MKEKKGISLIVLVITILVIIVLAGAVILTVAKDNPLDKASQANLLSNRSNIQYAIQLYISSQMSSTNVDTTKIMETLWASSPAPTTGKPNPIDFTKLDMTVPVPDATQKWVLDSATGKVFVQYTDITKVPGWAKTTGGSPDTILPEFADLFKPVV